MAVHHCAYARLVFVLKVAHPRIVALLANTLHSHFWIVYPLTRTSPNFDVDWFYGLEVFQNPIRPQVFSAIDSSLAEQTFLHTRQGVPLASVRFAH